MSRIKFQHVFVGLMFLSLLSAFAIPPKYTTKVQPQVQGLFAPVARPTRAVAGWAQERLFPEKSTDQRAAEDVRDENDSLRKEVAYLQRQLDLLQERSAERDRLGPIGARCDRFHVVGSDGGTRESLSIQGSTLEGLREGKEVLYPDGVVGKVERAGVGGAQVRLITDPASKLIGSFGTFRRNSSGQTEYVPIAVRPAVVEGAGENTMLVRSLTLDEVRAAGLEVGNWVALGDDPEWPEELQGQRLGKIAKIAPRRDAPLFAEIRVEPAKNLTRLRDVMVVVR